MVIFPILVSIRTSSCGGNASKLFCKTFGGQISQAMPSSDIAMVPLPLAMLDTSDNAEQTSSSISSGAKDIIERMLPVIDNFERGLASIPESEKNTAFAEGMEKIYKQFQKVLEDAGVKAIEAAGQPFDPNFHNAVMHVEDENFGENIVAEELQKGYMYRDSVVRHSMVKVAN